MGGEADETLDIQGISGTSAGAMNAGILASGLDEGRDAARERLERFWQALEAEPSHRGEFDDLCERICRAAIR